jgi:hypothetical protein
MKRCWENGITRPSRVLPRNTVRSHGHYRRGLPVSLISGLSEACFAESHHESFSNALPIHDRLVARTVAEPAAAHAKDRRMQCQDLVGREKFSALHVSQACLPTPGGRSKSSDPVL